MFLSRAPWKRDAMVREMMLAMLTGEEVTFVAPTQEQAESVFNEAKRRLERNG